jgi:hypothetical protein
MKTLMLSLLLAGAVLAADLPAPSNAGHTFTVTEVKAQQADLNGQVVRLRLFYNSASAPEQQKDGSLKMFVTGSGSYDFVVFPPEGAAYVRTFLKSNQGQMTFFAQIHFNKPAHIVGRGYDPRKQTYTW